MIRLALTLVLVLIAANSLAAIRPVWPPGRDTLYAVHCVCTVEEVTTSWVEQRSSKVVWLGRRTRMPERTVRPVCPLGGWAEVTKIETWAAYLKAQEPAE